MAIVPFFQIAGTRATDETRSLTVMEGEALPAGEYAFMEFYCNDPKCDCRRVIFQVWRKDYGSKVWATLTYGWEAPAYYAKWSHMGAEAGEEMAGVGFEQISPQTELSRELLRLCRDVLLADEAYVERLKRHYREACPGRVSGVVRRPRGLTAAEKRRERLRRRKGTRE